MENIGKITFSTLELFGLTIKYNPNMVLMTWLVMTILVILALITSKKLNLIPNKLQSIFELVYGYLEDITVSTLGEKDGQIYLRADLIN